MSDSDHDQEAVGRSFAGTEIRLVRSTNLYQAVALMAQWRFDAVVFSARRSSSPQTNGLYAFSLTHRVPTVVIIQEVDAQLAPPGLADALDVLILSGGVALLFVGTVVSGMLQRGSCGDQRPRITGPSTRLQVGSLTVEHDLSSATIADRPLKLPPSDLAVLSALASHTGRVMSRRLIAEWIGRPALATGRAIDMAVTRLRRRLNECNARDVEIDTVYGAGYRMIAGSGR